MEYTQKITLDLNAKSAPPIIYAKQGDADTRILEVHIMEDGNEYQPDSGVLAMYRVLKPDGTYIGGDAGGEIAGLSNNIVYIRLSEQALVAAGRALVDILLYNGNQYLSTMSFILNIQPAPTQVMRGTVSENEYNIFSSLMTSLSSVLPAVTSAADRAEAAASNAEAAAESINVDGVNITTGSILTPGTSSSIIDKTGTNTFELHAPVVKPSVTASVSLEKDATPSILVTTTSVTPGSGEDSNLLVNFDLAFTLPKNTIDVALSTTFGAEDSGKAGDAAAIGSAIATATTNIPLTALASGYLIQIENGGTGATTASAARTSLGAQALIQKATGTLASGSAWDSSNNTQSLTITGMTSNSEFVASPNTSDGWAAAADAMLFPPTAGSGILTFTCETIPTVNIPITVYWW